MRLTRKVLAVGLGFGDDKLFRLLGQRPGRPVEQRGQSLSATGCLEADHRGWITSKLCLTTLLTVGSWSSSIC